MHAIHRTGPALRRPMRLCLPYRIRTKASFQSLHSAQALSQPLSTSSEAFALHVRNSVLPPLLSIHGIQAECAFCIVSRLSKASNVSHLSNQAPGGPIHDAYDPHMMQMHSASPTQETVQNGWLSLPSPPGPQSDLDPKTEAKPITSFYGPWSQCQVDHVHSTLPGQMAS
jgi:hypothetical protein